MGSFNSLFCSFVSILFVQVSLAQSFVSIARRDAPSPSTISGTTTTILVPSGTPTVEVAPVGNYTIIDIWVPGAPVAAGSCNSTGDPYQRTVAYRVDNGYAVIDGDVVFGTEADILNAAVHPSLQKRAFSLTSSSTQKWPGGKVLYKFASGLGQEYKDFFLAGAQLWTDRLPFLQFVECPTCSNARTIAASTTGNNSPIGGDGGQMNLCPSCNPTAAAHEIGHTLGLVHEHQRPDRDSYLTLTCPTPGGVCAPIIEANVAKLPGTGYNWAGSYDLASLMHYPLSASVDGQPYQFILKPGVVLPPAASAPSKLDVMRVCELYFEDCHSICGDGIVSPGFGEECDDGNNVSGDGCSSSCKIDTPPAPVCVAQCHNMPPNNVCGFRSTCETFNPIPSFPHSGETYCLCQAGYRGTGLSLDGIDQYREEWSNGAGSQTHRVFVKPGQDCGDLCSTNDCSEVPLKNECR